MPRRRVCEGYSRGGGREAVYDAVIAPIEIYVARFISKIAVESTSIRPTSVLIE
jgi:hypothetical protein